MVMLTLCLSVPQLHPMADPNQTPNPSRPEACCPALNLTFAFWGLRLFIGGRLLLSGLEKAGLFVGKSNATWQEAMRLQPWIGPSGLSATVEVGDKIEPLNKGFGDGKMWPIAQTMLDNTQLPVWAIKPFLLSLPYAMVVAGVLILLGLLNRIGWLLSALIWFSLAFGQMLLPDDEAVQQLGLFAMASVLALCLIDHNRLRLTKF